LTGIPTVVKSHLSDIAFNHPDRGVNMNFEKALKETNKEIKDTLNYTNGQISNLQGLVDVMLDVNTTESIRNKAH